MFSGTNCEAAVPLQAMANSISFQVGGTVPMPRVYFSPHLHNNFVYFCTMVHLPLLSEDLLLEIKRRGIFWSNCKSSTPGTLILKLGRFQFLFVFAKVFEKVRALALAGTALSQN
jgi:hypothetical protein